MANETEHEQRTRILSQVPRAPSPADIAKGHDERVRQHGNISDATIATWKSVIADEDNSYEHRHLIWRTSRDALARIGVAFNVPEPVATRGKS